MSPINKISTQEKLFKLARATEIIEELRAKGEKVFLGDDVILSALMFNMIISIELILDVANHLLSEMFEPAKNYKDTVLYLGKHRIVPDSFAKENADMADFRNKLIHDYGHIDPRKVFEYSEKAPEIFRQFAKHFMEFMEKQEEKNP